MGICPSTPVCPSHSDCTVTALETPFVHACGIEYFGGAISSIKTSSVKECVDSCATTNNCVAVSFLDPISTCILRDASRTTLESLSPSSKSFYANITVSLSPSISSSASISSSISSSSFPSSTTSSASTTSSSAAPTPDLVRKSPPNSAPCPPQYAMLHPDGGLYKRNTAKRSTALSTWSSHLLGPASHYPHSTSLLPFPKFPNSTWSYTAHGTSPNSTWGAELSHKVAVQSYRSYVITLWSRQGEEGNCKVGVTWCGDKLVEFEPEVKEYALRSVLFGTKGKTEGDIGISVKCKKGGEGRGIVLGDAGMEISWAG